MRTKRIEATQMVATQLFAAEAAIDAAISETAKLSALMPEAKLIANLSTVLGQAALVSAGGTLQTLIAARHEIIKTHGALDDLKSEIGLRTMAMGGAVNKGSASPLLEVVCEAA